MFFKNQPLWITLLGVIFVLSCNTSEEDTLRVAAVTESEDVTSAKCVCSSVDDTTYYESYGDGVKLKLTNTVYLLPMSSVYEMGVRVLDAPNNRVIQVKGDLTAYQSGRFEDLFNYEGNEYAYFSYEGFNQDYETYIEPLSGAAGDWPYFDGTNTWFYVGNRDHNILEGDYLDFFVTPSNQFPSVYLPEVTDDLVSGGDTLVIQVFLSSGENVQVRRNEDNGLGRLQYLDESKTDEANVALYSGSGQSLYSLSLIPKEFDPLDGYTNYGWQVVKTNENFYRTCLSGEVSGSYSRASSRYDYMVYLYESGTFTEDEEENGFVNASSSAALDDDYEYELTAFPGEYDIILYSFIRGLVDREQAESTVTITPGSETEVDF